MTVHDLIAELSQQEPLREVVIEVRVSGGDRDPEAVVCPECDHVLPPPGAPEDVVERRPVERLRHDLREAVLEAGDEEARRA